jgi:hypothetical protein
MQTNKTHLPSFLTLIVLALSAVFLLGIAMLMVLSTAMNLFSGEGDPAGSLIFAFAFGAEMLLLLGCSWFVLQKVRQLEKAETPMKLFLAPWYFVLFLAVALLSIAIGAGIASLNNQWLSMLFLPILNILAISVPILFSLALGANGLEFGPRWRTWGMLGLSLTVGPVLMFILEMVGLIAAGVVLVIVIAMQPEKADMFLKFAERIQNTQDQEVILQMLAPYITSPGAILGIFGYLSVLVPMIEELLKPLAVWLFARSIEKPSSGFALGALGGAAFALTESLNVSGNGSTDWASIVSVRAATGLLHVTTAGLMGFAIISAFKEKRYLNLIATYFAVVVIHGLWNAGAAGAGLSTLGEMVGKPEWQSTYLPIASCILFTLGAAIFTVLLVMNRKMRGLEVPAPNIKEETGTINS